MTLTFSDTPGPRERHLRRKYRNPLFGDGDSVTLQSLMQARQKDLADVEAFGDEFRKLVEEAANLPPQADSEQVLALKERLDSAYERVCGLAGDQSSPREAIRRLVGAVMKAVWKGAGTDLLARQQLEQEEQARRIHYELLQQVLIADLLNPDIPIPPDQLAPTLLSESEPAVRAALTLLEPPQLGVLCHEARQLLERQRGEDAALAGPRARLELIEREAAASVSSRAH
ncbi:MAG: hypothetical protein PVI91_17985 [Gammaproteobacteria bacterium]|jgi:hypothetical protein